MAPFTNRLPGVAVWRGGVGSPTEEGEGVRLTIRLTHQEVADFLGISRVVVSQCFQSLNREGLLKKTRQHYLIPDRAALEAQLHT